jgi:hypothetical protein
MALSALGFGVAGLSAWLGGRQPAYEVRVRAGAVEVRSNPAGE